MIVQCPDCASRFRLADEKLKPGGTKVRCSKCQKIFTVKPSPPAPSFEAAAEKAQETDLSFEPTAESALQTEPNFADDDTETRQDVSEQGGVAFHEFDFADESNAVGDASDTAFENEFSDEFDFDALGADFGEESDSLFGDAEDSDEAFSFGDEPSFEGGDDFFMGEDGGQDDQAAPALFAEEKTEAAADSMSFAFSGEETDDSSVPNASPLNDDGMASDDADLFGEQSLDENDLGQLPPPQKLPKARKSGRKGLALLFFLVLGGLAGGGYFAWQKGVLDVNKVRSLLHLNGSRGALEGQIRTERLKGFFLDSKKAGRLFVIQGEAINEYRGPRSAVAVKGLLFDSTGRTLLQQTAFCGNPLAADELQGMPFERIVEQMNNQFGDSLSNLNVPAGKSIPFTVVFRNLPPGLSEFSVEVVDSKPASH